MYSIFTLGGTYAYDALSGGIIGLIFGFILQRTRFCMTGGFRDMYIARNNTLFYAFLIAITVESIGVLSLIKLGIIGNPYEEFSVLGAIVGSYLFGIGIVLAGDVPQERGIVPVKVS